jgi:hypothetical protein
MQQFCLNFTLETPKKLKRYRTGSYPRDPDFIGLCEDPSHDFLKDFPGNSNVYIAGVLRLGPTLGPLGGLFGQIAIPPHPELPTVHPPWWPE